MRNLSKCLISMILGFGLQATAQAAFIEVNGQKVEALQLTESFTSFYDYDNALPWSSNTGLELSKQIVGFFAIWENQLAFFLHLDKPVTGEGGKTQLVFTHQDAGIVLFKDDPGDKMETTDSGFEVKWKWVKGKNDGMIFLLDDMTDFHFALQFDKTKGIDDVSVWTFEDGQLDSGELISSLGEQLTVTSVTEPSTLAMMALGGIVGFSMRKRKARNKHTLSEQKQ